MSISSMVMSKPSMMVVALKRLMACFSFRMSDSSFLRSSWVFMKSYSGRTDSMSSLMAARYSMLSVSIDRVDVTFSFSFFNSFIASAIVYSMCVIPFL